MDKELANQYLQFKFHEFNAEKFDNLLPNCNIKVYSFKSNRWGTYAFLDREIRINLYGRDFTSDVVEHTLLHEMTHAWCHFTKNGREGHTLRFWRKLKKVIGYSTYINYYVKTVPTQLSLKVAMETKEYV